MKTPYAAAGFFLLTLGCASADRSEVERDRPVHDRQTAARRCVPLETKAWFSCWVSASNAPLSHCVAYAEDDPACGLKARGGAYLSRGAPSGHAGTTERSGGWMLIPVFADEEGRVGMAATRMDGTRYLSHHDQSPPPTDAPLPPRWPRWPAGLEFGPEQTKP